MYYHLSSTRPFHGSHKQEAIDYFGYRKIDTTMEAPTSIGRKRAAHCLSHGVVDFDDCSFDDASESYTESESMTFDDDEEEESFLETLPGIENSSNSYASMESSATPEERKNGLVLTLEMVQLLRKSASEGNVAGMIHSESMNSQQTSACHQKATVSVDQFKRKKKSFASKNMSTTDLLHLHPASSLTESIVIPSPKTTLERLCKAQGRAISFPNYRDVPCGYFVTCDVNPLSLSLLQAVRENDLVTIRYLHEVEGLSLQCSNKFQESLVHTVARHGLSEILFYLKHEAGVSMRVCCDGGRNALHDACWTNAPNFDVIRILIEDSPDLLYIRDKRNFTPLDYIPKEAYKVWNEWLLSNKTLLLPNTM